MTVEVPHYTKRQLLKRYAMLMLGLFIMSLGVAMSKRAGIGTTPISCVPATMSFFTPISMGILTFLFNAFLVLIEKIVLGKQFQNVQILQVVMGFAIGILIDISLSLLSFIGPTEYWEQWFWCILSCFVLGLGVMMEVRANVLVAPGEGVVVAFVARFKIPFPRMKVISDTVMVLSAAVMSIIFLGELCGVREGTIFSALVLGFIVGGYRNFLGPRIDKLLE